MSYSSKQSGYSTSKEIGSVFTTSNGKTIPVGAIVSGNQYTLATAPISKGIWNAVIRFSVKGDATTAFTSGNVEIDDGVNNILNTTILVKTTLPNTDEIFFTFSNPISVPFLTNNGNANVRVIFTFAGTAPTIPSSSLQLFKVV